MFQICQSWRRFSLIFLASLVFCSVFHAGAIGQAQSSAPVEKPSLPSPPESGSQQPYSHVVQQGMERYQVGQYAEAIALWQQALTQISAAPERAIVYSNLAIAYRQIGQLDRAITHWEQAIQIYRSQKDEAARSALARLLTEQGQAYSDLGQHKRAITLLQSAVKITQNPPERLTEAAAQGALGSAYWALGDYEKALAAHQTSLKIARELNYPPYITTALNNLGNVYVSRADRYTYQAELAQLEGNNREFSRLTQAATQDRTQGKTYFEQSWQAAQGVSGLEEARALMNWNRLLVRTQKSGVSGNAQAQITHNDGNLILKNFNRANELLQTAPDSRDKAYALINLAEQILSVDGSTLQPATLLEQALAVARKIGDSRAESFALGSLAELHEARGDLNRALELNRKAQFAAQQINAPDSLYRWQWHVGRMLQALGETKQAIAAYEQAIATLQSIRGDIVGANKDLQLDFREQVEPVYRELMALLLESPQSARVKSVIPAPKSLNQKLPTQVMAKSNRTASAVQQVVDILELLKLAELQNFFGDECVQVALAESEGEAALTDTNTVVVYSVILDNQTHLILRSPDGSLTHYPIAMGQPAIEKEIDQLRYFLELRATEDYLSQAQKIYDELIRPLEADLTKLNPDTLVFINDGVLRKVPMAALHDGKEFLIQKYPIATTPSLSLTTRKPLHNNNLSALSLGLTVERSPFASLSNVRAEVEAVNQILGGTKLIDEGFTLANLQTQLQKKSYPIVHIATHGKFGVDAESTFLVGFDQRLSIETLDNLLRSRRSREAVELLTLSACQTAAGDNRSALGIAGVAVRAGVESALATLWYINDEATVPLIKEFYNQLRQPNVTKAEALRQAQVKMIADANYNHPAVWSPFVLIGNWL
jgi:CHAT domain-containing protein